MRNRKSRHRPRAFLAAETCFLAATLQTCADIEFCVASSFFDCYRRALLQRKDRYNLHEYPTTLSATITVETIVKSSLRSHFFPSPASPSASRPPPRAKSCSLVIFSYFNLLKNFEIEFWYHILCTQIGHLTTQTGHLTPFGVICTLPAMPYLTVQTRCAGTVPPPGPTWAATSVLLLLPLLFLLNLIVALPPLLVLLLPSLALPPVSLYLKPLPSPSPPRLPDPSLTGPPCPVLLANVLPPSSSRPARTMSSVPSATSSQL